MKMLCCLLALGCLLALACGSASAVVPASLFTDHAVLQRGQPVPIWGAAAPGERVTVRFAGRSRSATAAADGRWQVELPAMAANAEGRALAITGEAGGNVTFQDVVVGEVWLAAGQSNMEWPVAKAHDADLEIPAAARFPLVREFHVAQTEASAPAAAVEGKWRRNGPDTVAGFSAVAYFFARDLTLQLDVPVGVIHSSKGGTPIEQWLSPRALAQARGQSREQSREHSMDEPQGDSVLYHGMITPLAPYGLRGMIWYQGEANAYQPEPYAAAFRALIEDWRRVFGQGDVPFYWVQLPAFGDGDADGTNWARLREAQAEALALPATGQAVTIDLGNVRDAHPRNKITFGRRLARIALHRSYGLERIDRGPFMAEGCRTENGFRIRFGATAGYLVAPLRSLSGFEVAGADRRFYPADARIEGETVTVASPAVPDPVAVRYAWRNAPPAGLFNAAGLPAEPFRTDDW